jgi:hypothetical protein
MGRSGHKGFTRLLILALTAGLAVPGAQAAGGDRRARPFIHSRRNETAVAVGNGYVAWQRTRKHHPGHSDVMLRKPTGKVVKVNRGGTDGALGGIDRGRLVYQEYRGGDTQGYKRKGWSRLVLINLKSMRRRPLGKLNSAAWEYKPSISQNKIMFGRVNQWGTKRAIVVYDLKSGREKRITYIEEEFYLQPGQINGGRYLVWIRWDDFFSATANFYDLKRKTGSDYYLSNEYYQWAPSVTAEGDVYFLQTHTRCGTHPAYIRITRKRDGYQDVAFRLPDGIDGSASYAYTNARGLPVLLFQRVRCGDLAHSGDIYKFLDAFRLTVEVGGDGKGTVTSTNKQISCSDGCTRLYRPWAQVMLTAHPAEGSEFAGWRGACYGQALKCRVKLGRARHVAARFDSEFPVTP